MDFDTAVKVEKGEMPPDWYVTFKNEDELVAFIEIGGFASVIGVDLPGGFVYCWVNGEVVFATNRLIYDGASGKPNPDHHFNRYKTAKEAVSRFMIDGKPLAEVACGLRFFVGDMPPPAVWGENLRAVAMRD